MREILSWLFTVIIILIGSIREWWNFHRKKELLLHIQEIKEISQGAITKDDRWKKEYGSVHAQWQSMRSTIEAIIQKVNVDLVYYKKKKTNDKNKKI